MSPEIKTRIDEMDYESMLRLWRFAKAGCHIFQGEAGDYFSLIIKKKRKEISNTEHTRISKAIGWDI